MEEKSQRLAQRASESPLPVDRAFVVQLRPRAHLGAELFVGRIEHIASGAAERFGSAEGLISFVERVLAPAASAAGEEPSPAQPVQKEGKKP
jgi:hypothetical protein